MVLIKDMDMPKRCIDCACLHVRDGDGEYTHGHEACGVLHEIINEHVYYGKRVINPFEEIMPNCPLREVVNSNIESTQNWIPCSKRLPETIGEYLITVLSNPSKNHVVSTGYFHERIKEFGTFRMDGTWEKWDVIAWMPLPEPWEGE